jgi:hypothetical protein
MGHINKVSALLIVISVAMVTLIMMVPLLYARAETPIPSRPICDIELQGPYPKSIPPVYEVDPATGKVTMIKEGYTIYEKSLLVRIGSDQLFMPYNNSEGQTINLYYNLRWKDHQATVWQSLDQVRSKEYLFPCSRQESPTSPVGGVGMSFGFVGSDYFGSAGLQVPDVAQLDFQAEAFIGYYLMDSEGYVLDSEGAPIFVGQSSGWGDIVTYSISERTNTVIPGTSAPSSTLSSSPSPDPSNEQSDDLIDLNWENVTLIIFAVIILAVAAITVTLLIFRKSRGQPKTDTTKWP